MSNSTALSAWNSHLTIVFHALTGACTGAVYSESYWWSLQPTFSNAFHLHSLIFPIFTYSFPCICSPNLFVYFLGNLYMSMACLSSFLSNCCSFEHLSADVFHWIGSWRKFVLCPRMGVC